MGISNDLEPGRMLLGGLLGPSGVAELADGVQDALFDAPVRTSATIVRPTAESG